MVKVVEDAIDGCINSLDFLDGCDLGSLQGGWVDLRRDCRLRHSGLRKADYYQFTSYLQSGQPTVPTPGMMPQVPFQPGTFPVAEEKQILAQQLEFLENQIEAIRKRLTELEQEG